VRAHKGALKGAQPVDEGEKPGYGLVEVRWDGVLDLAGAVDRPREWRVLHDGHAMGDRLFPDPGGQLAEALGKKREIKLQIKI